MRIRTIEMLKLNFLNIVLRLSSCHKFPSLPLRCVELNNQTYIPSELLDIRMKKFL